MGNVGFDERNNKEVKRIYVSPFPFPQGNPFSIHVRILPAKGLHTKSDVFSLLQKITIQEIN